MAHDRAFAGTFTAVYRRERNGTRALRGVLHNSHDDLLAACGRSTRLIIAPGRIGIPLA